MSWMLRSASVAILVSFALPTYPAAVDVLPQRKPIQDRLPGGEDRPATPVGLSSEGLTTLGKTSFERVPPREIPVGRVAPIPPVKPWIPTCNVGVPDDLCSEYPASWRIIKVDHK